MEFLALPNEVLECIIEHSVQVGGLESLALTCRLIYELSVPFLDMNNNLCRYFRDFKYNTINQVTVDKLALLKLPDIISSAFDLIVQIAMEPAVGHHMRKGNFNYDLKKRHSSPHGYEPDDSSNQNIMRLFATSPFLKRAGLDWMEYWEVMNNDLSAGIYSQHAAAFVLSLFPNLRSLSLPSGWKPEATTDRLIEDIVLNARDKPDGYTSLAQVTNIKCNGSAKELFNLDNASSLLALPHLQSFEANWCKGCNNLNAALKYEALELVSLWCASINEVEIAKLLQNTPNLKTFKFTQLEVDGDGPQTWNLCHFVMTIAQKVGNHLEDLSILFAEPSDFIRPSRVSLRGFKQLKRLELPLEIVVSNMMTDTARSGRSLIRDLIPASITHLSFISRGSDEDAQAIAALFLDFSTLKAHVPFLQEVHLTLHWAATDLYTDRFNMVSAEIEGAGVLFVKEYHNSGSVWRSSKKLT